MFLTRYSGVIRHAVHRIGFPPFPLMRNFYLHTKISLGTFESHTAKRTLKNVLLNPIRTIKPGLTAELVQEKVLAVCSGFDKITADKLKLNADFIKDMGLDSLDHIEVIMEIENEFWLEISDIEAEKLQTPQDIVNHVCAMATRALPID